MQQETPRRPTRSERMGLPPRTTPVTPWDPSRRATARVPDPLPLPETCHHCGSDDCRIEHHDEVYGQTYGEWPWLVVCKGCGAHVGLHPFTAIPLGFLATEEERQARKAVKPKFIALFTAGGMTRQEAYEWLARAMGLARQECHFAMFSLDLCAQADALIEAKTLELVRRGLWLRPTRRAR